MNMNPYESPGEPERADKDARSEKPLTERPMLTLFRALAMALFVVSGSLLGMAYMLALGARKLNSVYYVSNSLTTVLLMGGFLGALLSIAMIAMLRVATNAVRRRGTERPRRETRENRSK